ncbi:hypothetical protein BU16DRAFT_568411 [Lophium mytilinum]|uniref:Uncharacterized protein n=1 Tax=Lophium mytilinum TaxID=390894 RepID=A0A6A6Q992_9PEZI|nr:hypothetical protein BU16DRAFT_568411 [Lophium mytilinum]
MTTVTLAYTLPNFIRRLIRRLDQNPPLEVSLSVTLPLRVETVCDMFGEFFSFNWITWDRVYQVYIFTGALAWAIIQGNDIQLYTRAFILDNTHRLPALRRQLLGFILFMGIADLPGTIWEWFCWMVDSTMKSLRTRWRSKSVGKKTGSSADLKPGFGRHGHLSANELHDKKTLRKSRNTNMTLSGAIDDLKSAGVALSVIFGFFLTGSLIFVIRTAISRSRRRLRNVRSQNTQDEERVPEGIEEAHEETQEADKGTNTIGLQGAGSAAPPPAAYKP